MLMVIELPMSGYIFLRRWFCLRFNWYIVICDIGSKEVKMSTVSGTDYQVNWIDSW